MGQVQWIKVCTDIFDNEKMKKLLRNREGDAYFRVWIQMLTLAGKSNRDGAILLGENIPIVNVKIKLIEKFKIKLIEFYQFF